MIAVLDEVQAERYRQDMKWGEQNHDESYWLGIHMEELGEVAKTIIEKDAPGRTREELVQLAATCVAHIEAIDRRYAGTHVTAVKA